MEINKKDFDFIYKQLKSFEDQREDMIKGSRDIIRLSKQAINSVHRKELEKAKGYLDDMKGKINHLDDGIKDKKLSYSGQYRVMIQEYIEALSYYELIANGKLPEFKGLDIDPEYYLLGLADLSGELMRKATNSAIDNDFERVIEIKDFLSEIYSMFMQFDFRNGELRKKFDGMKYDLKKVEDLVFQLKVNGKIQ